MKKALLILVTGIGVLVAAVLAVGFFADAKFAGRREVVIDAPIGKVWEVVSSVKRTPEWFPKDLPNGGGGVASVREEGVGHTYVRADGKTLTLEVVERSSKKKYIEKVVATDTGMDAVCPEMWWGFELAEAGDGKTRLTVVDGGTAARPLGVIARKAMEASGMVDQMFEKIARGVERVARGDGGKEK